MSRESNSSPTENSKLAAAAPDRYPTPISQLKVFNTKIRSQPLPSLPHPQNVPSIRPVQTNFTNIPAKNINSF
jgi:hypothetical protein